MGNRKQAVDFYNQAVSAVNDLTNPNRLNHAYQLFSSAALADPSWGEAWYMAGNNNNDLNLWPAAVACWREALNSTTDKMMLAKIMCNLSWRLMDLGHIDEAYELAMKSVDLDPTLDKTWVNLSVIHTKLDQPQTAVSAALRAYELLPSEPMNEFALAMAYFFNRQWEQGFRHYESRFAYRLKNYLQYPYPKWDGEPGKTVYLVADQGIGDTLSFARFLPQMCERASFVHASVQPELFLLFSHLFYQIKNLNLMPSGNRFPDADAWTTFMSLPNNLRLTDWEIVNAPKLPIDDYEFPVNWRIPDRKLHIGIAWAGSALNDIDRHRNIPVLEFLELYKVPGIQLYSLQKSERNKEMYDAGCMSLIYDLTPYITTIVDTIALVRKLDLVICCESLLTHICAAAGAECWIPYSFLGRDYRLGCTGEDQLWSSHRIFRQGQDMRWQPVFLEIIKALRERVDANNR